MAKDKLSKREAPGPLVVPDFLQGQHGAEGFGNMERGDLVLPRLSICQAMTPQRKKTSPNYIEGLGDGDLFNSVSGEVYGEEIELIPLLFSKARIYFRPLGEGGGVLCQSFNGVDGGVLSPTCAECPNSQFDAAGKAPLCNLFYNYPSLLVPSHEAVVVSLKSTGLKVGKNWNSLMRLLGDRPMYAAVYGLRVVEQANQKGTFFSPVITRRRFVTPDEFALAASVYAGMQDRPVRVDETGIEAEVREPGEDEL